MCAVVSNTCPSESHSAPHHAEAGITDIVCKRVKPIKNQDTMTSRDRSVPADLHKELEQTK